jgi:hypothetical protein
MHLKKIHVFLSLVHVFMMSLFILSMKSTIFWDVTLCSLVKANRHFKGAYHLNLESQRISQARHKLASSFAYFLVNDGFLLGLLQLSYKITFFPQ